nr:LacI family DNA-binding transcriptional regulator [uncultured Roseobacter sp.]
MPRHARQLDIAKLAGVGIATVDRVLNSRGRVKEATRQRVLQAKAAIENGTQVLGRVKPWRLKVFLPDVAGPSTDFLGECFQRYGELGNATIECIFTAKMEPAALARKLRSCEGQGIDAVAFQALEDQRVRDAVEYLRLRNIPCLALVSPLPNLPLIGFVGSDGRAGGRTAALMMGLACPQGGRIVILSGGQLYRSHESREMGFRSFLRSDCPHLDAIQTVSGQDDSGRNFETITDILQQHQDIVGIYNVGGGNEGVVKALDKLGLTDEVKFIGHNLTPKTRNYLLDRAMHFIIHQDMRLLAEQAVEAMLANLENRASTIASVPVEVITRENLKEVS